MKASSRVHEHFRRWGSGSSTCCRKCLLYCSRIDFRLRASGLIPKFPYSSGEKHSKSEDAVPVQYALYLDRDLITFFRRCRRTDLSCYWMLNAGWPDRNKLALLVPRRRYLPLRSPPLQDGVPDLVCQYSLSLRCSSPVSPTFRSTSI